MKSISKFLSGYLFILSTAPTFTSGMECSYSDCTSKDRHSTELTVELPCGCKNHAYCLVSSASRGGYEREDDQYTCLNKQCPNPKQGYFETA